MKFKIFFPFFFLLNSLYSLEHQKILLPFDKEILRDCPLGYFYIDSNEQGSGGGHGGLLVEDYVYHYQRIYEQFFILDKTESSQFIYNYSRILNRNLSFLCIDLSYVKQDLSILKNKLELKHTKDNFFAFTYLYYNNLLNQKKQNRLLIPTLPYFTFSQEEFFHFVSQYPIEEKTLKDVYHYNITLYLLEIFYKYYQKHGISLDYNHFIKIHHETKLNEAIKKNLWNYLKEWEEEETWIKSQISEDTYLTLLESTVYKEVLKQMITVQEVYVPYLLVKHDRYTIRTLEIQNKTIDLKEEVKDPIHASIKQSLQYHINHLYTSIYKKESLQTIQYYLKKISLLANQFLLLKNHANVFSLNIGILHTPHLFYIDTILYKWMKQKIPFYKDWNETIQKKLISLKYQHPVIFEYNLIFKNCITELFLFIYQEVDDPTLKEIFYQVYNNHKIIYNTINGHFIPWKSYNVLKKELEYHQIPFREYFIPSFRNEYLKVMKEHHQNTLREMITFTSEVYQYNPNDSFFIFFTEQSFYLRPILGCFNMFFSFLKISYDLLKLPYDIYKDEVYISKEFRGLFFSFTELGFVNVRKGTYLYYDLPIKYKMIFFETPSIHIKK